MEKIGCDAVLGFNIIDPLVQLLRRELRVHLYEEVLNPYEVEPHRIHITLVLLQEFRRARALDLIEGLVSKLDVNVFFEVALLRHLQL